MESRKLNTKERIIEYVALGLCLLMLLGFFLKVVIF